MVPSSRSLIKAASATPVCGQLNMPARTKVRKLSRQSVTPQGDILKQMLMFYCQECKNECRNYFLNISLPNQAEQFSNQILLDIHFMELLIELSQDSSGLLDRAHATCKVSSCCSVHELLLGGFSHYAVCGLESKDGAVYGDRVTDLDGRRKSGLGLDGLEVLPSLLVGLVQWVGIVSLQSMQALSPPGTGVIKQVRYLLPRCRLSAVDQMDME